jgi:hypothetical protein
MGVGRGPPTLHQDGARSPPFREPAVPGCDARRDCCAACCASCCAAGCAPCTAPSCAARCSLMAALRRKRGRGAHWEERQGARWGWERGGHAPRRARARTRGGRRDHRARSGTHPNAQLGIRPGCATMPPWGERGCDEWGGGARRRWRASRPRQRAAWNTLGSAAMGRKGMIPPSRVDIARPMAHSRASRRTWMAAAVTETGASAASRAHPLASERRARPSSIKARARSARPVSSSASRHGPAAAAPAGRRRCEHIMKSAERCIPSYVN